VLVVSGDRTLVDPVIHLVVAAGGEVDVVDGRPAPEAYRCANLVLVGSDTVGAVRQSRPGRRPGVLVVTVAEPGQATFEAALDLGAESVLRLPDDVSRLADRLADVVEDSAPSAPVLAVLSGRGGGGASTFAATVALVAERLGRRSALIDADPLGGGLDLALGAEDMPGVRWSALAASTGRLSGPALRAALPTLGRLVLLSADADSAAGLDPVAMSSVLEATRRTSDLVVVDVARHPDAAAAVALGAADLALVVVPAEVRATAAARRVVSRVAEHADAIELVVRGPSPASLRPEEIGAAVGRPVCAYVDADRGLDRALDHGLGPLHRSGSRLRAAARAAIDRLDAGARSHRMAEAR
jgi:secretion/DNA translocation related CpaE-like protein